MTLRILVPILLACGLLAVQSASAQHVALSARAGTLGPGIEVATSLDPHFNLRIGANYLGYSRHDYVTDLEVPVDIDSKLRLASFSLIGDAMPFQKLLRISLGFVYNAGEATALMVPAESYTIEGKTFSPARIGTMEATVNHGRRFQPYMGLGLGNPTSGRVTFLFDLGMLYTDSPRLNMVGNGMIAPTAQQAPDLEAAMYSFRWYPVASIGLALNL